MVTLYGVTNMPEAKEHTNTPLLETKEVVKHYPITGGIFLRQNGHSRKPRAKRHEKKQNGHAHTRHSLFLRLTPSRGGSR